MLRYVTIVAAALLCGTAAQADTFPSRPIKLIVAGAAGGTSDILARLVSEVMSKDMGQPIVVENVGGGGGTIALNQGVTAPPDGYTINFGNTGTLTALGPLYPDFKVDPRKDLAPIGIIANVPMALGVSNAIGIGDLQSFLAHMKAKPGAVNFGTGGVGATGHLAATLLLSSTGLSAQLVNYRGAGPAITDLMGGTIDAVLDQTATMIPLHNNKNVKVLAVTAKQRLPQIADVPTFVEAGLPSFDMVVWNALVAPAETPEPVLQRLHAALDFALSDPAIQKRLADMGAELPLADQRSAEHLKALIEKDVDRWSSILTENDKAQQATK